jgi:hypothetical protein
MKRLRLFLAGLLALAVACGVGVSPSSDASATILGPPSANYSAYVPRVCPIGDSIVTGVNSTTAGWRTVVFNSAISAGTPILFVGNISAPGGDNSMAINPWSCGQPGFAVRSQNIVGSLIDTYFPPTGMGAIPVFAADVAIMAGGTNDVGQLGDSASTVLASISSEMDLAWAARINGHFQIVQLTILPRLDSFNTVITTVNAGLASLIAGKSYHANVTLIDITTAIVNPTIYDATTNPTGGYHDPVHPNAIGDNQIGAVIWTPLQAVVVKARGVTWRTAPGTVRERLAKLKPRSVYDSSADTVTNRKATR